MKKMAWVAALALGANFGSPALAVADGSELLRNCENLTHYVDGDASAATQEMQVRALTCSSYLSGVLDAHGLYSAYSRQQGTAPVLCLPDDIDVLEAARVVVRYLSNNPDRLEAFEGSLVFLALLEAFPCGG
jgi:hypothetical protein